MFFYYGMRYTKMRQSDSGACSCFAPYTGNQHARSPRGFYDADDGKNYTEYKISYIFV